jgi:hypothetical protein
MREAEGDATRFSERRGVVDTGARRRATRRARRGVKLAMATQPDTSRTNALTAPASTGTAYGMPGKPVGARPPRRPSPRRPMAVLISQNHAKRLSEKMLSQSECHSARACHEALISAKCGSS